MNDPLFVVPPEGLGRDPGSAHAQKTKIPVDEVEYHGGQTNRPDMSGRQLSHQSGVYRTEQGHRNVADDIGNGQAEDLFIHDFWKNWINKLRCKKTLSLSGEKNSYGSISWHKKTKVEGNYPKDFHKKVF